MCQMSVVLEKNGEQEMIMKGAARLTAGEDGVTVNALFEEPVSLPGVRVKAIDFLAGLVTLAPLAQGGER
jgi:predicted RNA-binding protein